MIQQLESGSEWDICIIGGGATGLGTALDAASRGYRTILLEQSDFAGGTSSRSTKLVHGGVRYLQQGNIRMVMEALKERGLLLKNAPHIVHNLQFIVPNYKWWEKTYYGIGLKIYDKMAGRLGLGPSQFLSKEETLQLAPTLDPGGLRGGVLYHDGQFDDARLAISLAQTAAEKGAVLLNYFPVTGLLKLGKKIAGVWAKDVFSGKDYEIRSKIVINATGVFTDAVLGMDNPGHEIMIRPSQGIHLVVDRDFLPGHAAILIPRTDDGRVLFAVPWHHKIVLGTTDTPVDPQDRQHLNEPVPYPAEIDFVLSHIGRYLTRDPKLSDIRSRFAGWRPLVRGKSRKTAALARDHLVSVSESGLITVTGGKWTTYRKMAEDVINIAMEKNNLPARPCLTASLPLAGQDQPLPPADISNLDLPELTRAVTNAVEFEMCQTVEDYLSRRSRQLLLDAKTARDKAPLVAQIMAKELHRGEEWIKDQINIFNRLSGNYLPADQI